MTYTHYIHKHKNKSGKVEFLSNEEETWVKVNGVEIFQSNNLGHYLSGWVVFLAKKQ